MIKNNYRLLITVLLLTMMLLISGCSKKEPPPETQPPVDEQPQPQEPTREIEKVKPVTVVINNFPEARPQSGLQQASIVYEFLAEGGITRLLAVYDTPVADDFAIGPVRSLRPYFAVQAMEHGGIIAHSGYSERTKEMIRGLGLKEITSSTYLARDSSRKAPHNLYTSMNKLYKARGESQVTKTPYEPADLPTSNEPGTTIEVNYSKSNQVSYQYDESNQVYLRFINGKPHTDRESKKQYSIQRVILRKNNHTNVPGTDLVDIDLAGSGQATLYEQGKKYDIRWQKNNGTTHYTFNDGTPVNFLPGNTWIQVIR